MERRGAGGAAGRSGGAAHVLVGVLTVLVALVSAYALQHRAVQDKRADLARTEAEATQTEGRVAQLASFSQFTALRATRQQTVTSLAASRYDWAHSLRELARVIPSNVWLTSLQGTVGPGVTIKSGSAGTTGGLRAALPVPAVELVGCTTDQDSVARMLTRMRLVDGVTRVSLQSSTKNDGAQASSGGGDCREGSAKFPQFSLVVFFDQAAGAVPTTTQGAAPQTTTVATGATGATGPSAIAQATP